MSTKITIPVNDTTIAESFYQKNILPNDHTVSSLRASNKQSDWKGRVIANIEITRSPLRPIIANTSNFFEFRRYVVSELSKKLGSGFYISVNTVEIEDNLHMRYYLKVRVSKMIKQEPAKTTAPIPQPTPIRPPVIAPMKKTSSTQKKTTSFAVLSMDDD